eukprot:Skav221444  [mRNA]  locus=scaffold140:104060:121079:+ [translate_table: standard]
MLRRAYLHHAPLWLLRASYVFMLYVEVIFPFCGFFAGPPRFVGAWGLIILMVGIFLTGNWGQFNLGYIVVCLGLLDLEVSFTSFFSQSWLLPILIAVYFWISLIHVIFDTWTNTSLALARFLAPFRLINAYGVFPPEALPQAHAASMRRSQSMDTSINIIPEKPPNFAQPGSVRALPASTLRDCALNKEYVSSPGWQNFMSEAWGMAAGKVLLQLSRRVAARTGEQASALQADLLQELSVVLRSHHARAIRRRRAELAAT